MTQVQALEYLFEQLTTGSSAPDRSLLYLLSCLTPEGAAWVRDVWPTLPVDTRRQVMDDLVAVAEADFQANFVQVFRIGLEDADADVRASAVGGLWEDEDVRLIPSLIELLHKDESFQVREAAAISLGRFVLLGELRKILPKLGAEAYDALLKVCHDEEECLDVQRRALESISYVDSEQVIELIGTAYNAPEEKLRVSAVFSMGRSADSRWADHVQQELYSPSPELRYEAARACGELVLEDAVPDLRDLADDVDAEVQEAALWALGQIGGRKAWEILESYLDSESEAIRAAAEAAMNELLFLHGDLDDMFNRLADDFG